MASQAMQGPPQQAPQPVLQPPQQQQQQAGRAQPQPDPAPELPLDRKAYHSVVNDTIFFLRRIRQIVNKMDELVVSSVNEVPEPEELEEAGKLVEHFDCIEQLSKKLGKSVPTWDGLENFKSVYQEEQYELSAIETIDSAIDAGNWNESNYQTYSFSQLFLQPRPYTRRATSLISKPIPYSNWHPHNPHRMFEQCFARLQAEYKKKKIGIQGMYLEQGTMQALIELRFGGFLDSRQFVCSQKMLLIVQYGILEGVIMVAPHEDWFFTDATGDKKVDTTKESEYLVYRKLTTQTNIHLVQMSSQVNYQNPEHLSTLFNHFAKIQHIFDTPCKSCSKVMKDFLPPTIYDFTRLKLAYHEGCK